MGQGRICPHPGSAFVHVFKDIITYVKRICKYVEMTGRMIHFHTYRLLCAHASYVTVCSRVKECHCNHYRLRIYCLIRPLSLLYSALTVFGLNRRA